MGPNAADDVNMALTVCSADTLFDTFMMEAIKLDEEVRDMVSLAEIMHPCPPRIASTWNPDGSVHQDLVVSRSVASASHRMRDLSVKIEGVARGFRSNLGGSFPQQALSAASIRDSRKKALASDSNATARGETLANESGAWVRERKLFDDEVERERQKILEDFKRGLREGVQLGI